VAIGLGGHALAAAVGG